MHEAFQQADVRIAWHDGSMDETQRVGGGAAGVVATIDENSARVLLEAARDRARGVRETADAVNAKLSWVSRTSGCFSWQSCRIGLASTITSR